MFFRAAGILFPVILGIASSACAPSLRVGTSSPIQPVAQSTATSPGISSKPKTELDLTLKNNRVAIESFEHFKSGDFAWLEKHLNDYRKTKERVQGGVWLLHAVYVALERPEFNSTDSTDDKWNTHFDNLQKWKSAYPDSISARIAIAESWIEYAWKARGGGPASSVSDANFKIFGQRINEAARELFEAKELQQKCPEWYYAALLAARALSVERIDYDRIYDEGAKFEPNYYYLHREKATYLLPRWSGNEGDWPKFAEEASNNVGGDEGKMLYFILVADMYWAYRSKIFRENNLSWDRIKVGFNAMQQTYGASDTRLNDFASLAVLAEDFDSAKTAFDAIGDKWDESVWKKRQVFDETKKFIDLYATSKAEQIAKGIQPPVKKPQKP